MMNIKKLAALLSAAGINDIEITYSGSSDEGYFNEPTITSPEEATPEQEALLKAHQAWFIEYCEGLVDDEHVGWEVDDGASGTLQLNCAEQNISLDHIDYYQSSEDYNHEWSLDDLVDEDEEDEPADFVGEMKARLGVQ